jgi:hypothetical protein
MLIDKYLSDFHFSEKHSLSILSDNATISLVLESIDFQDSKIIRFLFWLRGMPSKMLSIQGLTKSSFTELERIQNEEIVIGLIGQFWKSNGNLQKFEPLEFITFDKPNFLKAVWNFTIVLQENNYYSLSTETRVFCTDEISKRRFSKYWFFVRPFSGLIRMEMLRAIKKSAERKYRLAKGEAAIG